MSSNNQHDEVSSVEESDENSVESRDRRAAVAKLAYASPVLAGLLFANSPAAAQSITPPDPP